MPLLDMLQHAKTLTYIPPPGKADISAFTEEEVYEAAMYQLLGNPTILYALILCCKTCLPIKILIKQSLRRYVAKYSAPLLNV